MADSTHGSKNPIVFLQSHGALGYVITALMTSLVGLAMFFIFHSSPPEKDKKGTDSQIQMLPQQQPQQQQNFLTQQPQNVQPAVQNTVQRSFVCQSAGQTKSGLILLNDTADYRQATVTVVIRNPALISAYGSPMALKGRTIVVTGTPSTYNGKPQIEAQSINVQ